MKRNPFVEGQKTERDRVLDLIEDYLRRARRSDPGLPEDWLEDLSEEVRDGEFLEED